MGRKTTHSYKSKVGCIRIHKCIMILVLQLLFFHTYMNKVPLVMITSICPSKILLIKSGAKTNNAANGVIGMNWGRQSAQRLVPSMVVDLLLQNGVNDARIYTSQDDILQAFVGSGINLTIGIFNTYAISTKEQAKAWVQKNVPYYSSANIRQVYIGNYIFTQALNNTKLIDAGINTLTLVQTALNEAGYGDHIKATLPHTFAIVKDNITRPSEAEFKDKLKDAMNTTLRFLQQNNAPFVVEIFPISYVTENKLDPSFAFPDNKSTHVVTDVSGPCTPTCSNSRYDSFVWALEKAGAPDMKLIVGQVGWPTDGYPAPTRRQPSGSTKASYRLWRATRGPRNAPDRPSTHTCTA
ncbi:hypothetical protein DH2020_041525 [Rehmannia glutinosa]|uniref:Glucan endo-1,3-beta-D-glucosidase n=1 Tax=Rehmannia glutinosa TaxID=99300 RepID=A0ABR0UPW6_REHGL